MKMQLLLATTFCSINNAGQFLPPIQDFTDTLNNIMFPSPLREFNQQRILRSNTKYSSLKDSKAQSEIQDTENVANRISIPQVLDDKFGEGTMRKLIIFSQLSKFWDNKFKELYDKMKSGEITAPIKEYMGMLPEQANLDISTQYYSDLYDIANSQSQNDTTSSLDTVSSDITFNDISNIFYHPNGSLRSTITVHDILENAIYKTYHLIGNKYWGNGYNHAFRELFELHDLNRDYKLDNSEWTQLQKHLNALQNASSSNSWGYRSNNGPKLWSIINKQCDNTKQKNMYQSPIAISAENVITNQESECSNKSGNKLVWKHENFNNQWTISKNNDMIKAQPLEYCALKIMKNSTNFCLSHIDLHFGFKAKTGSEHTIYGETYDLEIQFVHIRNDYGSMHHAISDWKNLQHQQKDYHLINIVSVMFEISDNEVNRLNALNSIIAGSVNSTQSPQTFDVRELMPVNSGYYTYYGSLTQPNCDQMVQWYVMKKTLKISKSQLKLLRQSQGDGFQGNYRPIQTNANYVYSCNV